MGEKRRVGEDRFEEAAAGRIVGQTAGEAGEVRIFDFCAALGPIFQPRGGARGVAHPGKAVR